MTPVKQDFDDFKQKMGTQYGTDELDWDHLREMTAILTFTLDERGNVSSRYMGLFVFRNRDSGETIQPGETWIVSLTENPNTGKNYFAKPIKKLDASFMFELKKDQMDEIADYIWKKHADTITPQLNERYSDILKAEIAKAADAAKAESAKTIEDLNAKVAVLEHKDTEDRQIIASLEEQVKTAQSQVRAAPVESHASAAILPQGGAMFGPAPSVSVRRVGPDTIESSWLAQSRYFVHLSADHRIITIVPHPEGVVVCMNGQMSLAGLNDICPYAEPYDMLCEYSPLYGGILIHLK
jgi:hypothetical protein